MQKFKTLGWIGIAAITLGCQARLPLHTNNNNQFGLTVEQIEFAYPRVTEEACAYVVFMLSFGEAGFTDLQQKIFRIYPEADTLLDATYDVRTVTFLATPIGASAMPLGLFAKQCLVVSAIPAKIRWSSKQTGGSAFKGGETPSAAVDSALAGPTSNIYESVDTPTLWQVQVAAQTMDYDAAKLYCEALEIDGHSDWLLPSHRQVRSLRRELKREAGAVGAMAILDGEMYWTRSKRNHLRVVAALVGDDENDVPDNAPALARCVHMQE